MGIMNYLSKPRHWTSFPPNYDRLCINHYVLKSVEEYHDKIKRYKGKETWYNMTRFRKWDAIFNKVKDTKILDVIKKYKST